MSENNKEEFKPTREWVAIPRIARTVPFGYKIDPEDKNKLLPIILELEALEKAKQYVKRYPWRAVCEWLEQVTGRKISHIGLRKRLEVERRRRYQTAALKNWAKRYEKAQKHVEKIQNERTGASERTGD